MGQGPLSAQLSFNVPLIEFSGRILGNSWTQIKNCKDGSTRAIICQTKDY